MTTENIAPTTTELNSAATLKVIHQRILKRAITYSGAKKAYQLDTGRDLLEAKSILPHGEFGLWCEKHFGWSSSQVHNLMNVAKLVNEDPIFGNLSPSAQMALGAPSTPQSLKDDVKAVLKAGKVPTSKEVSAKIAAAKPKKLTRPQAKSAAAGARVAAPPVKQREKTVVKPVDQDDLVRLLKAVRFDEARAAFKKAYPGSTISDNFENAPVLLAEVKADEVRLKAA